MARVATDVLVGTGTLFTAPLGTAFPVDPTVTPAAAWEDIGYSEDGWIFAVDKTFEDVLVAEEVDALRVLKTAQEIRVRGVTAQATLENLQIAMGGGTIAAGVPAAGFRTYSPPASATFTELAVLLRALAPPGDGSRLRDIQCQRTVATGAIEMPHAKAPAKTVIAVDFRLIIPSAGDIFNVVEDTSS